MKNNRSKTGFRYKAAAAIAVTFVFAAGAFLFVQKSADRHAFLNLTGAPEGTKTEALLETKHGAALLNGSGGIFTAPVEVLPPLYRIHTSLQLPWGDYRDIVFNVDRKKSSVSILADGFTEDDNITLTLGDKVVYKNIPMDWSGRLELQSPYISTKETNSCVVLSGRMGVIGLCHLIPEGRPA